MESSPGMKWAPVASETNEVFAAFVAAQAEFLHVVENASVSVGKTQSGATAKAGYATLPRVIETLRPILNKHGLGLMQPAEPAQGGVKVKTMLVHTSGQSISDDGIYIPAARTDPQGHGSALSYARRYGLLSMLGVATADDDGQTALQGIEREKQAEAKAQASKAQTVDEREAAILCLIGKKVTPATSDEKLAARYADVLADDFEGLLQTGLKVAVERGGLAKEQADAIVDAVDTGATVDEVRELLEVAA